MRAPGCLCGDTAYDFVIRGRFQRLGVEDYAFSVVRCRACGLARTLPVPDVSQYEQGFAFTTDKGHFTGSLEDQYSAALAEGVAARAPGGRFLDIGCGVGNLVAAMAARGFDAEGVDVDPVATEEGRRLGRRLRTGSLDDFDGRFGAIVLNHTLEHVADPAAFLIRVEQLLDPRGLLFVFVPHYRGWIPRLMGDSWMGWAPAQHLWHFTPPTLLRVAREAGFRVVECYTRGMIEPPSSGAKGRVKAAIASAASRANHGDEIEAIFAAPQRG